MSDYVHGILFMVTISIITIECSHRNKILEPDAELFETNSRYKYVMYHPKITFNEARTVCQAIGGDLAVIDSQQTLDTILELVDDKYASRSDFFRESYWLGLVQVTENNFQWIDDCSPLTFTSNYAGSSWKDNELCLKHHRDEYTGQKEPCSSNNAFMCQVVTEESCSYYTRLESTTLTMAYTGEPPCLDQCSNMSSCWGTMDVTGINQCVHLVTSGNGNSSVNLTTKFCVEVEIATELPISVIQDDNRIPNQNCTPIGAVGSTVIAPTSSSSLIPTPSPSDCPSIIMTMVMTPSPVYITEVMNVTVNVTETETITDYINVTQVATVSVTDTINVTETLTEYVNVTQTVTDLVTEMVNFTVTAYPVINNITDAEAEEIAEEYRKNSTVNSKATSAYLRTLISAEDKRTASKSMGYVGIVFVVVPLVILILSDIRTMFADFTSHLNIYRNKNNCERSHSTLRRSPVPRHTYV